MSGLEMIMPEHAFVNDDVHGRCTSGENLPRIAIKRNSGCNFKIERNSTQDTNTLPQLYVTDFVVKSVTATCKYMCVVGELKKIKIVVITGMYIYAAICTYM